MRMLIAVCPPSLGLLRSLRGKVSQAILMSQIEILASKLRDACAGLSVLILFRKSSFSSAYERMGNAIRKAISDSAKSRLPEKSADAQVHILREYLRYGTRSEAVLVVESSSVLERMVERYLADRGTPRKVKIPPGTAMVITEQEITMLRVSSVV